MTAAGMMALASLALLASGCARDTQNLRLVDLDTSDMSKMQELASELQAEEKRAFLTYLIRHIVTAEHYCGKPLVGADGQGPATVRDAIRLTREREGAEQAAALAAKRTPTQAELNADHWRQLVNQRELLINRQMMLTMQHGEAAAMRLPEWRNLKRDLAQADLKLEKSKPVVFGSERASRSSSMSAAARR